MIQEYDICNRCVMDTSDSKIRFDRDGICDHCNNFHKNILPKWNYGENGYEYIKRRMDTIRERGRSRSHDCLIGISGGVDSSYLTHIAKCEFGLNPLVFHVDGGWNSQQAVNNIERLVDSLELDLHTEVINWREMRDLQLAYFKAQVPTLDTPQDHAFFSSLYNFAEKNGFEYILTGANYSTECIREPLEWNYHTSDLAQLKDIHNTYGSIPLKSFPTADIFKYKIYYRYFKNVKVEKPLNYIPYIKDDAVRLLETRYKWQIYEHKHYESRFTRFYEGYWLPEKFGYDKRRTHFSSLILTNQMSRDEALSKLATKAYSKNTIEDEFDYIATKLNISSDELMGIMNGENRSYKDYKNRLWLIKVGTAVLSSTGVYRGLTR